MISLKIDNLFYHIGQLEIIRNIDVEIHQGEFVGLIGPNGSGKSTLLKNIYKVMKPSEGDIWLNSKNLLKLSNKDVAKELAVVAQESDSGFDFTVEEIVMMGRHPYKGLFEPNSIEDQQISEDSLHKVGMLGFKDRSFISLSGGEKQRVLIARALVQDTRFLILDEPTNHLDIGYQIHIMDLIRSFKITSFAAIHDLNIAAIYCDRIIIMKEGRILDCGTPEKVITGKMIMDLFGIEAEVSLNTRLNKIQVHPLPGIIAQCKEDAI